MSILEGGLAGHEHPFVIAITRVCAAQAVAARDDVVRVVPDMPLDAVVPTDPCGKIDADGCLAAALSVERVVRPVAVPRAAIGGKPYCVAPVRSWHKPRSMTRTQEPDCP